jgi:hypothetical protein
MDDGDAGFIQVVTEGYPRSIKSRANRSKVPGLGEDTSSKDSVHWNTGRLVFRGYIALKLDIRTNG